MKFQRHYRVVSRPRTPQRVASARRVVERDHASVPLFPELRKYSTADDRLEEMETRAMKMLHHFRQHAALSWRKARRILYMLPRDQRIEILAHWNSEIYPLTPEYLLDVLHRIANGSFSIGQYNEDLNHVRNVGKAWRDSAPNQAA